jgi:hypothetical protein
MVEEVSSKTRSREAAMHAKNSQGLSRPYLDHGLRRNRKAYVAFVRRFAAANCLEYRASCTESVGVFTVTKKNGKLRLIIDARLSNCWFEDPMAVDLATGMSFATIEVDSNEPLVLGQVDIANAFYAIELPEEFRTLVYRPFGQVTLASRRSVV